TLHSTVEYRDDGPWAVVGVEDGGVGFREPEAARLFAAFYTRKPGGPGVGPLFGGVLHDEAGRARDGPIDQPLDHRGAWGTAVGDGECGPRRHFPFRPTGNRAVFLGLRSRPINQNS